MAVKLKYNYTRLEAAAHGNTKYPWEDLKQVNDLFTVDEIKKRKSISASLKNYNKKNETRIRIRTKRLKSGGFMVVRIKDADPVKKVK